MTTTLYEVIRSELLQGGHNEFVDDDGNLIFFDDDQQVMGKVLRYDGDIKLIVNDLFNGLSLQQPTHDTLFKKMFMYKFLTRHINRQTIDSFKLILSATFLQNETYLNTVYQDLEKYVLGQSQSGQTNQQQNTQTGTSENLTDNRQAYADLPQNNVQLDVNSTVMNSATDNTISRNKQTNTQQDNSSSSGSTENTSHSYNLENLLKTRGLLDPVLNEFDRACFKQTWY